MPPAKYKHINTILSTDSDNKIVIFCTLWEVVALPITRKVIRVIKYKEGLDTYDQGTIFSPFKFE